jgi:2-polyprenyl-3-methyl-5-hydroxy-6-metoxy-1,4-benzoquinol methylase/uncharacterized protein YbaR (Trm112 family)
LNRSLLDILACPHCRNDEALELTTAASDGDQVIEGALGCKHCGRSWPVRAGIPRFIAADEDYAGNFGFQWQRWRTVQIDRLNGHTLSEDRLLGDTGWARDWFPGRLVLDAGCGAGRFADILGALGARVIAVDLSAAIDACRETCAHQGGRVECVQASITALPFRRGVFDGVHCAGVIQHTPDPARTIAALPVNLRRGGRLAYNFYEKSLSRRLQLIKYGLRRITPDLPPRVLLWLTRALVMSLFPITLALSRIRFVRYLTRFIPIAAVHAPQLSVRQQYVWTQLDTFDWYSPRYEISQDHHEVARLLADAGLVDIASSPGIARGTMP